MIDWSAMVLAPCIAAFGEPVVYTPAGGAAITVSGVFDEANHDLDLAGGTPQTTEAPVLGVRLADFTTGQPQPEDTLTVTRTGNIYVVREVRLDGHGGAKLLLNQTGP